jgi:hypothetical protein
MQSASSLRSLCRSLVGLASLASGALVSAAETPISADIYAPMALEQGTWDADITFYENDKPASKGSGVQINTLLVNGHWITNDFQIPASEKFPAYQGHGVWGYDPVAKTYVDTWVDTNDLSVRTDYGYWQPSEQIMTWSSKQADGKGHFIDYRMIEEFKGDTRVLTFYQLGIAKPTPHTLIQIVFARHAGTEDKGNSQGGSDHR